jgi:hypothetical protein
MLNTLLIALNADFLSFSNTRGRWDERGQHHGFDMGMC